MTTETVLIKGLVGLQQAKLGEERLLALGVSSDLLTQPQGKYFERTLKGQLFHAITAAGGVAPGTALGTTAAFALYNPNGSGRNLVILQGRMGYVSGTLGAGVVTWNANIDPAAAATTGTAITPVNGLLGQGVGVGKPFTTATLPATPSLVRVLGNLTALLASTAVGGWVLADDVDGAIIVQPGTVISLHATAAAGSSPLVIFSVTFIEVPV